MTGFRTSVGALGAHSPPGGVVQLPVPSRTAQGVARQFFDSPGGPSLVPRSAREHEGFEVRVVAYDLAFFAGGGQVESRTMSSGSTTSWRDGGARRGRRSGEDGLGGKGAHGAQRLADGGEGGILEGGGLDVVEADDGDILGDAEAGFAEGADGADGGDVVEGEEGGEVLLGGEQALGGEVAGFVRGGVAFELRTTSSGWIAEPCACGRVLDGLPAGARCRRRSFGL